MPIKSCVEIDIADELPGDAASVLAHWRDSAGGRWAPAWTEIDLLQMPPVVLPEIEVCDVIANEDFVYRYWGRAHTLYHRRDYSGEPLSAMKPAWIRELINHQYMRVVETRAPRLFKIVLDDLIAPLYALRLPLSEDGERVTGVLGYAETRGLSATIGPWISGLGMAEAYG